ncbi:hypothetical protein BC628DRAFT_1354763 [Trametes gibbosa]|nr:hypothetical protein BC628DRAFT_1354763 [Trametes gibbosa]
MLYINTPHLSLTCQCFNRSHLLLFDFSKYPRRTLIFIMFVKSTLSTFSILATCAFLVNAAAMEERIEERQLGSLVDSITQAVGAGSYTGDIITGIASGFAPSITSFHGEPTTVTTTLNGQLVTFTEVIGHPASGSSKATSAGGSGESTA